MIEFSSRDVNVGIDISSVVSSGLVIGKRHFVLTLTTDVGIVSDIKKDFVKLMDRLLKLGKYEYFAMFTSEGNGVVHVLLRDCYLPRAWFESNWVSVHQSYIVYKEELRSKEAIVCYLMKHFDVGSVVSCLISDGWLHHV